MYIYTIIRIYALFRNWTCITTVQIHLSNRLSLGRRCSSRRDIADSTVCTAHMRGRRNWCIENSRQSTCKRRHTSGRRTRSDEVAVGGNRRRKRRGSRRGRGGGRGRGRRRATGALYFTGRQSGESVDAQQSHHSFLLDSERTSYWAPLTQEACLPKEIGIW